MLLPEVAFASSNGVFGYSSKRVNNDFAQSQDAKNTGIIAHYHNLGKSGKTSRMLGRIPTFNLIIIKAHIVKVVVLFFGAVTK